MAWLRRLGEWMWRWRFPVVPVALGVVLVMPSLWVGIQADDYTLRAVVRGEVPVDAVAGSPWHPFRFLDGDPARNHRLMDFGWLPWWSEPTCHLAFLRPVTALTHMLDYLVWPDWPVVMHVQSIVWFALLLWAVAALYRRVMGATLPGWTVGLGALLFALDEAHAWPAGWLANRNAALAGLFGTLALLAHDRWRRDGWTPGAWLAPLAFAVGLLAKEATVAASAYLFAYAVFLDRGTWRRRALSLVPCLVVGVAWLWAFKALGFGLSGSAMYVDPLHDPVAYAGRLVWHAPVLLLGQWGLPASETRLFLSASAARVHWLVAVGVVGVLCVLLAPTLRRSRVARFWAVGMVLSLLPACAPFPHDRLLMFVGLGAMALIAQWLGGVVGKADWVPEARVWRGLARAAVVVFVVVHLVVAPAMLAVGSFSMRLMGEVMNRQFATLPTDPAFGRQTLVFVNALSSLTDILMLQHRQAHGQPVPRRTLRLSPSCTPATLSRVDATTLVVRPAGGYLPRVGEWWGSEPPAFTPSYFLRAMDMLFRSHRTPMRLGERVELSVATIEITALTPDGRPAEATFRFAMPLEDASLRWLRQTATRFEPFAPPAVGESVDVPSPLAPDAQRSP